jgi:hypothetical protein
MAKRGRPIRLVNAYAEFWPIRKLRKLPEMRGIYILYDRHYTPLYCGRAGKGAVTVQSRIYQHKSAPYYGSRIRYFSVYDVDRGYMQQIETLFLRALVHKFRWNTNRGKFRRTAWRIREP